MREGAVRRREERQRSSARTGTAAAEFARQRIDAYLRRRWKRLLIFVAACGAGAALIWFIPAGPDGIRGFSAGIFLAATVAATYHWVVLSSGAAGTSMGQAAEEWTSSELRRLRRRGWRTIDHLILRPPADIDHVAVGPDGVIVVETKWTSLPTDLARDSEWLQSAAFQVRRSERDLARFLGWGANRDAWITPLLVVWGPEVVQRGDEPLPGPHGVNVIAGQHLRMVLDDLGAAHLKTVEIEEIYAKLAKQMDLTDRWAAEGSIDRLPTLAEMGNAWARRFLAGSVSFTLAILSLQFGWAAAAVVAVLVAGGVVAKRGEGLRPLTSAWLFGVALSGLVLLGALGAVAVAA